MGERKPRRERSKKSDQGGEKKARGRRKDADDEPVPAGEWNGPKPGFLDVGTK